MYSIFDTPPLFVNDLGVKWWKDEATTNYAKRKNAKDVSLNVSVFFIEERNGTRALALVDDDSHDIITVNPSLEAIAIRIDAMKALKVNTEQGDPNVDTDDR